MTRMKALAVEYFDELLNKRNIAICDKLLSSNYTDNDAPEGTPPGPLETKEYVTRFLKQYPDMKLKVKDVIAEGNTVAMRNIWHGTHAETGDKFHKMGIIILHFSGAGQIERRWSAYVDM